MSVQDGGHAFPGLHEATILDDPIDKNTLIVVKQGGMSLRDWFAGMAIQPLIAAGELNEVTAVDAYDLANQMLKERDKNKP